MIKELFILIKMIFGKKPKDIEKPCLMGMKHFPFKGYSYLMWCGKMIYRDDMYDRRRKEWPTDRFKIQTNHEHIHLMQAKMCGSWVKYYLVYLWEWLKGNPLIAPSKSAYYTNKLECEAYANEDDLSYCKSYDGSNLKKYDLKNRKSLYKRVGNNPTSWKNHINLIK